MSRRKIEFMTLLEDYFEKYLPHSRGLSPNTIVSYKQSFLLLLRFMQDIKGRGYKDRVVGEYEKSLDEKRFDIAALFNQQYDRVMNSVISWLSQN